MSDYYPPNTHVFVVMPGDPHTGEVGTVTETRNDAGDMVHKVQFCEGRDDYPHHVGYYLADELRDARLYRRRERRG
ncbi:hypothetical protein [Mycobacterium intracellulare]|uniref:DUF1918 domain-containing protein n=1 Tax=Mycobacterium intracellulare (strain ATCC 13950 / DSM 43223 / JCM 6384 / NCTC 13025 / 3600) TaxID=487521 RepID=H8IW48_MYCIA|nr:hypothetical protein [Mycobacterium intracellulare]AFC45932.1 hypothetical protein OCU_47130 [Mycobacterium intracellulare ATCC 13950]ETZ32338.1 hypothetical protein L843_5049 [Mycobacterium intracellulare MIN_061107_1834]MCA2276764.1 hypothetical protein [Mycobacterium intracellulare]MCA2328312.1 hypothetical protein [Mycobacterium intracellulare]UEB25367.1 hypothetical protein LK403_03780 [Mycobacterium intracellulare]